MDVRRVPTPAAIDLLIDRGWGQEVVHQLILHELFSQSALANRLGIWASTTPPTVAHESFRGLFDLALSDERSTTVLVELKGTSEVGEGQRHRQREFAEHTGASRAYILLGVGYWAITREPGPTYIGLPQLAEAVKEIEEDLQAPLRELASAYARRLARDVESWTGPLTSTPGGAINFLRLYAEIAAAWPVEIRPYRATNRSGPQWILNADAWTAPSTPGWEGAELYWELVDGRLRFKVKWSGHPDDALRVREAYRTALEEAATSIGVEVRATRARRGLWMTAAEFPAEVTTEVLIDGRVDPAAARALYDRATQVFQAALIALEPLTDTNEVR